MKKVIQPTQQKEETKAGEKEKQGTKIITTALSIKGPVSKTNSISSSAKASQIEPSKQTIKLTTDKIVNGKQSTQVSKILPKTTQIGTKSGIQKEKSPPNSQQMQSSTQSQQITEIGGVNHNPMNNLKFFECFDEKIVDKILYFFQFKDFAKVATISRKFRERIPQVIKSQDFSKTHKRLKQNYYSEIGLFSRDLVEINKEYNNLIKKLQEIQDELLSFSKMKSSKTKEGLLDILVTSVNFFMNVSKKKVDIIDYILSVGIATVFKPLSYHYVLSSQAKITLALFPDDAKDNVLTQLIRLIHQYFGLQQNKKLTIQQQKKGALDFMMYEYLERFERQKQIFIIKYERPIMCLKNTSNVFDYLNKNNIQLILPFLSAQEITLFSLSCKSMYELIRQGTISVLENLNEKRKQLLIVHDINDDQAKAVMYLAHYRVLEFMCEGWFVSYMFKYKEYKDLLTMVCKLVSENIDRTLNVINNPSLEYVRHYHMWSNIHNAKFDQLENLNQFLLEYSDEFVTKGQLEQEYNRPNVILLQKFLKGMKLYIELKMDQESYPQLEEKYKTHIFKIDNLIHRYQRLFKLNKEQLDLFVYGLDKPFTQRKVKDIARELFY